MANMWQSSNPAFNNNAFNEIHDPAAIAAQQDRMTASGVINKTAIFVFTAMVAGAVGYAMLFKLGTTTLMFASIAAFVIVLGSGFVLCRRPGLAREIGFAYALVEGFFLGGVTALVDNILAAKGLEVAGGAGLQAFVVTMACVCSMLILYRLGWVRPTERLKSTVKVLTIGVMLAYLVSFVMSLFGTSLPLISFGAAVQDQGAMGLIGLGLNLFILGLASLWLVIDFGEIEKHIAIGAPRKMEWFFGFALLVTLAWIYFEALKLVLRLAVLFGGDD